MNPLFKTTILLLSAGAMSLYAQGKSESGMEQPSGQMKMQHHDKMAMESKDSLKEAPALHAQTTCPVTGDKINKKLFVDYQGRRIYVCCEGCIAAVKKDPEKYISKLEASGQSVVITDSSKVKAQEKKVSQKMVPQKTCPVMGNPINKDLYVDYKGKRIYVCCGGCIDPIKNDPEKYLKKLSDMGEMPGTVE